MSILRKLPSDSTRHGSSRFPRKPNSSKASSHPVRPGRTLVSHWLALSCGGITLTGKNATVGLPIRCPVLGRNTPASMHNVDFHDPFAPRNATTPPFGTASDMPLRIGCLPNESPTSRSSTTDSRPNSRREDSLRLSSNGRGRSGHATAYVVMRNSSMRRSSPSRVPLPMATVSLSQASRSDAVSKITPSRTPIAVPRPLPR